MTALPRKGSSAPTVTVVIPTVGRPSLRVLLGALEPLDPGDPGPDLVVVVDDRPGGDPLELPPTAWERLAVRSHGIGPAGARNVGWRLADSDWVAFLDDDVLPPPGWYAALLADLTAAGNAAGTQGCVQVPLPPDRRPTDWERGTAGLAVSRWITADMAYRRDVLREVGGFDERFRRAFREDSDLALRVLGRGHRLVTGRRHVQHPVRPADAWVSVRAQAGNADDVLMTRLHGKSWREKADAPKGCFGQHAATVAVGVLCVASLLLGAPVLAAVVAGAWLALWARFTAVRVLPGPRTPRETAVMAVTSAVIPWAAVAHRLRGIVRHRRVRPWRGIPEAVLFDRDGTLVEDVPYNGDPDRVRPMPGARAGLDRLRNRGVRVGVVSNQSGVGQGRISVNDVRSVNARVEELLGPFHTWQLCLHAPDAGCPCRKPSPSMVLAACLELGTEPARVAMVGDIGADVEAAHAAGSRGVMVPTPATRSDEVRAAHLVARDLGDAVDLLLGGTW